MFGIYKNLKFVLRSGFVFVRHILRGHLWAKFRIILEIQLQETEAIFTAPPRLFLKAPNKKQHKSYLNLSIKRQKQLRKSNTKLALSRYCKYLASKVPKSLIVRNHLIPVRTLIELDIIT